MNHYWFKGKKLKKKGVEKKITMKKTSEKQHYVSVHSFNFSDF